jgi:DNA repair protein SbcC/Rad50
MINTLKINNFQSHENSLLEFDPGVNIIIGKSDSGKTAILRALKWLITNKPSGDSFRSSWGGKTEIGISTHEGNKVARIKDKGVNSYWLDDMEFNAFGAGVPEEITKALNVNEINLQAQFDQPFLLTSSPGEVAAHFNKIANIDQIDISMKLVQSWIRGIEQEMSGRKTGLEEFEESLLAYAHLEKFEIELEVLEEQEGQYQQSIRSQSKLNSQILSIEGLQEDKEEFEAIVEMEKEVDSILEKYEDLEAKITQLSILTINLNLINSTIENTQYWEDLVVLGKPVGKLLAQFNELAERESKYQNLYTLRKETEDIVITEGWQRIEMKKLEKKLKDNMPEVCPLCNQKIKS